MAAAMTMMVLAVAGGVMWGHRTQSAAATIPPIPAAALAPSPVASPNPSSTAAVTDWRQTVTALEAARARAFVTGSVAALDAVYAARSAALAADTALLRSLAHRGLHTSGFWITTIAVHPVVVTPETATVRVTDAMPAYALVDASGRTVQTMATRSSRTFTMRVVRPGDGWRIAAIRP
jgi:hypothetical protein